MSVVTFAFANVIEAVAQVLPDEVVIGAQYDVDVDGTTTYAIFWEHEDTFSIVDQFPHTTLTVPFAKAIPTLSEVFGLYIPCMSN